MKLVKRDDGYSVKVQNTSPKEKTEENEVEALFEKIMVKIFLQN